MRVYEIAKELGLESKVVIQALNEIGVPVKSHANSVSDEEAAKVKAHLAGGADGAAEEKEAAKKTPAKQKAEPEKQAEAKKAEPKKPEPKKAEPKKPEPKKPEAKQAEPKKPEPKKAAPERKAVPKPPVPANRPRPGSSRPLPERGKARMNRRRGGGRRGGRSSQRKPAAPVQPEGPVIVEDGLTVKTFAERAGLKPAEVIRELMQQGVMANLNQMLEIDVALQIAESRGIEARVVHQDEELLGEAEEGKAEDVATRAPIVTIMGHVDHGKTQLLDSIRETNVVAGEAGGITQHIGASEVEWNGNRIVFIDTPGHEAFTRMRARGAQITDVVVLVVAGDDGIMPQTVEAIDHAKAAEVPIIVAINKIDKPQANIDRVKQQMLEHGLTPEDWGGDVVCVPVSAKTKENLTDLLEMIVLTAELLELKANPEVPARGVVLEAELDRQRGPVATVLVQEGTLDVGESLIAGQENAKVRAMVNARGEQVKTAGPSTAVEILGFGGVPQAGDSFQVVEADAVARKVAEIRQDKQRRQSLASGTRLTLEDLHSRIRDEERAKVPVVLKGDTQGSVETLKDALVKLSNESVEVEIMHAAVGGVSENDVLLASASDAIIVGFNVRPERGTADAAEREGVQLRLYTVIYQLIDDVKAAMVGQLSPTFEEETLGAAEVRDLFKIPKAGTIAGCYVTDGKITRDSKVRLVRDSRIIHEGKVGSLRRFKDDVREVQQGYECGIGLENYNDVKLGDVIEAFRMKEIAPTLS